MLPGIFIFRTSEIFILTKYVNLWLKIINMKLFSTFRGDPRAPPPLNKTLVSVCVISVITERRDSIDEARKH